MAGAPPPPSRAPGAPRLLICAFGPFPGVPVNPSQQAVRDLLRVTRPALAGLDVRVEILPTRWDALARLGAVLDDVSPDGVLLFGVAARRRRVSIETRAVNAARPLPDAEGRHPPGRRLRADAPDTLSTTADPARLLQALRAFGVPAGASRDAGRYLCNASFLDALAWERKGRGFPARAPILFVHLPGRTGRPSGVSRARMAHALSGLAAAFAVRTRAAARRQTA